jgi:sulfatase maturation enzyme AslB (radical SAM superfamily)
MNPELARALGKSGLREISISIDGTEEFHNLLRGLPFAFERAWNALDLILTHAPGVKIVVNSVLTPYNLKSLLELGKKLSAYPDVSQKYLPLSCHELFKTGDCNGLLLPGEPATAEEIGNFLNSAVSNPRLMNSSAFLRKAVLFFNNAEDVIPEQKHCLYPYFGLEFDARGFAYPCVTGMERKNGLNPDSDLESFLGSGDYRALQTKLEECKKCRGSMMLCYYEPRLNFPLHKLLYYSLVRK